MADTLRIGGIKLSGELVQFDVLGSPQNDRKLLELLRIVTEAKINIPHLHQTTVAGEVQTTFCIAPEDALRLQHKTQEVTGDSRSRVLPSVGTLSLFPHGCSLDLFVRVVQELLHRDIALCGISTSVSALVIHLHYGQLEKGVEAVLHVCRLPQNHTPLRAVPVLDGEAVETIAVYWEPQIRIYGMDVSTDFDLVQFHLPSGLPGVELLENLQTISGRYNLLLAQNSETGKTVCSFLAKAEISAELVRALKGMAGNGGANPPPFQCSADLLSFHGPHFQDRYGIVERIFAQLQHGGIVPLVCGCTGTSVHIVIDAGQGLSARRCLEEICVIPSGDDRRT